MRLQSTEKHNKCTRSRGAMSPIHENCPPVFMLGQRRFAGPSGDHLLQSLMNSSFVAPVPKGEDAKLEEGNKLLQSVQEAVKLPEFITKTGNFNKWG